MKMEPAFYECKFCEKKLLTKAAFEKHECETKTRYYHTTKTNKGRQAYSLYSYWLGLKNRGIASIDTFITSKYYNSFQKFVDFSETMGIPDRKDYISVANDMNFMPSQWRLDDLYTLYIKYFDKYKPPLEQAEITLNTLDKLAAILDCKIHEVFENLYPNELAKLIQERKLSPWLLLCSSKFKAFMNTNVDHSARIIIYAAINTEKWNSIMEKNPSMVKSMKVIAKESGL